MELFTGKGPLYKGGIRLAIGLPSLQKIVSFSSTAAMLGKAIREKQK
ncbi:hypothetical protein [Aquimarina macrocephali]